MNWPRAIYEGPFGHTDDGRLLFFAVPRARTAFVVPDAERAAALRLTSRYWGAFEVVAAVMVAPLAMRYGAPGLLIACVIFALSSAAAYQYAVRQWIIGLDRIVVSSGVHLMPLGGALAGLRTIAAETHAGILWFYQTAAAVPFAASILMVSNARSARHLIGGLLAMAFFGAGGLAASYMLALKYSASAKHRSAEVETHRAAD